MTAPVVVASLNAASGASSYAAPVTAAVAARTTLAAVVTGGAADAVLLADSQGGSWHLVLNGTGTAPDVTVWACNRANALSTLDTVTATFPSTLSAVNILVVALPGSYDIDAAAAAIASGTSGTVQSAATGTRRAEGGIILAFEGVSTVSPAWTAPLTALSPLLSGNGAGFCQAAWTAAVGKSPVTVSSSTGSAPPSWTVAVLPFAPAFPASPLDLRTELNLSGTGWTDISTDVYQRNGPVVLKRGRPDETSQANASSAEFELNNRSGNYSPKNAASPYFGKLGRNTPVRFSIPAQDNYLRFETDATSYVSCPDSAALHVTGDLDLRIALHPTSYAGSTLASKSNPSGTHAWLWQLLTDGTLRLYWSADGSSLANAVSAMPIPVGQIALRVTLAVAASTVTFYTAATITGPWTQLGSAVSTGASTSVFASTAPLIVGDDSECIQGSVQEFRMYNGIGGTLVADPVFTAQAAGTTSFADAQGNTWTLNGTAEISDRNYRYHGEMASLPARWDVTGTDISVPVTGAGLLRRIGQGQAPLMSPMKRAVLSQPGNLAPVAYWPCEDGQAAASIGSAAGGPAMTVGGGTGDGTVTFTGPAFASDTTFLCSSPLPVLNGSTWRGAVPPYTSHGSIVVRFLMRLGSTIPAGFAIIRLFTSGTCNQVALYVNADNELTLSGADSTGATVFSSPVEVFPDMPAPVWVSIELTPGLSGVVNWAFPAMVPGSSVVFDPNGSFSGTVGSVQQVVISPAGALTDTVIGHVSVQSAWVSLFSLFDPLNAWQGETAGHRFTRVLGENSLQARIIGPPDVSAPMGAQPVDTLGNILQQCESADHGQIFEPRQSSSLGYRTLASMYNQAPAVTADYSQAQPGGTTGGSDSGLQPTYDDQFTRNDETVTRGSGSVTGSAYQYQLDDGSPMSISPPPAGAGDYSDAQTVNVQSDAQLPGQAGWLVRVGTVDEARWPAIPFNLARPALASLYYTLLGADIGDYAQLVNMLRQVTYDPVKQLPWQVTETLGGFVHELEWVCVPESPYEVAAAGTAHADTGGSQLNSAVSAAATSLPVATTPGNPPWTQNAADFPFDIGVSGEQVTVSSITGVIKVGAFLSQSGMGVASFSAASSAWATLTGQTITVTRWYKAQGDFSYDTNMQAMVAAGVKICLTLRPNYNPVSSAHLASINTLLSTLQAAGAVVDVTLWHEPFFAGLTSAQYIAMVQYYGPTIRAYYPLVFVTSAWSVFSDSENSYYPGDAYVDKCATDIYCDAFNGGATLALAAQPADSANPPKPFGIWELGSSTDPTETATNGNPAAFFSYVQAYMTGRVLSGYPCADVLWFNGGGFQLVTAAAAYWESGTIGWSGTNATLAVTTAQAHTGTHSLQITATASGTATAAIQSANEPAVTAGTTYSFSAWVRSAATARTVQIGIEWFNGATPLSSSAFTGVTDSTGAWTQVSAALTAPASATLAQLTVQVLSAAASEVHYIDDVLFMQQQQDVTVIGAGFGSSPSSDTRIAPYQSLASALAGQGSPQAFTVTRSVNGVSKSQAAGAAVALWQTPVAAL